MREMEQGEKNMTEKKKNEEVEENWDKFIDTAAIVPMIKKSIELGHNVALRGSTGTGKTFLVRQLAKEYGVELATLNMTVNTSIDEIKGRYVLKPNKDGAMSADWFSSSIVNMMKNGGWVVIEEANFMRDEVASVLYSVMDDRREIILDEHEGEVIKAHKDFRVFMTMNWDYAGTQRFNSAIMNRINAWYDIDYLPSNLEAKLISGRTGIELDIAMKIAAFAKGIREASRKEDLPDLSTRILINWAQYVKNGMPPMLAGEITAIPVIGYGDKEKNTARSLMRVMFGEEEDEDDEGDD